jgi:hypothetical protein
MRLDPDELAASALDRGDLGVLPPDTEDRDDLLALRRVVRIGRGSSPADAATDDPPADLWDRIAASVRDEGDGTLPQSGPAPDRAPVDDGPSAPVVSLASRRRPWKVLAAAAAVVVVVVGATAVAINRSSGSGTELVASADLRLLEGGGTGSAELVRRSDGMHLVVDVSNLSPAQQADFYELWLLTPDGKDPQSLTTFRRRAGVIDVAIPPGMSTSRFPVVDISEEVDDGNPGHSGKSILRGTLA